MERCPRNPILTPRDVPDIGPELRDVSSVFNPGAIKFEDRYLLMLRVQNRGRETFLVMAESEDGETFSIRPETVQLRGIEKVEGLVYHVYDPRITMVDGMYYIMVAMDMEEGCHLGLARTADFAAFDFMGLVSEANVRNGVLFPEKVGGRYVRLDRPNRTSVGSVIGSGESIRLSESSDLLSWRGVGEVASGRWHYWDELVGPGPPPVKTRDGWLLVYHGIATHFQPIYQVGAMLLDLENPGKLVARSRYNVLEPREMYEMVGQVPNVVFPGGMVVESFDADGFAEPNSLVRVYYGAADTVVAVATTTVRKLIDACRD